MRNASGPSRAPRWPAPTSVGTPIRETGGYLRLIVPPGWCRHPGSNWGPTAYKAVALPTELCRRIVAALVALDSSAAGHEARRLQRGDPALRGLAGAVAAERDAVGLDPFAHHQQVAEPGGADPRRRRLGRIQAVQRRQVHPPSGGARLLAGAGDGLARLVVRRGGGDAGDCTVDRTG